MRGLFISLAGMACLLLCAVSLAWADEKPAEPVTYARVLAGNVVPLKLKLHEMDAAWMQMRIAAHGGGDLELAMLSSQQLGYSSVYFTRGQILTIGDERYLVTYSILRRIIRQTGEATLPEPLTPDMVANISLLDERNIGNLLDIRPVEFGPPVPGVAVAPAPLTPTPVPNPTPTPATVNPPPFVAPAPPATPAEDDPKVRAQQIASLTNLRQLALAMLVWAQEHNGALPPLNDATALKAALKVEEKYYAHPTTHEPYLLNGKLAGASLNEIPNPMQIVLAYEAAPGPDGKRGVAYVDGHGERLTESKWTEVKARSGIADTPAAPPPATTAPVLPTLK